MRQRLSWPQRTQEQTPLASCDRESLRHDGDVLGEGVPLGHRLFVLENSPYVHFNRLVHVARDLVAGLAGGNTAGQVRRILELPTF